MYFLLSTFILSALVTLQIKMFVHNSNEVPMKYETYTVINKTTQQKLVLVQKCFSSLFML